MNFDYKNFDYCEPHSRCTSHSHVEANVKDVVKNVLNSSIGVLTALGISRDTIAEVMDEMVDYKPQLV